MNQESQLAKVMMFDVVQITHKELTARSKRVNFPTHTIYGIVCDLKEQER